MSALREGERAAASCGDGGTRQTVQIAASGWNHAGTCSLLLLALLASPAPAQSSKEYSTMAKQAWAAFKCSVWAGETGNKEEQERLFQHGYQKGQRFLTALLENKVQQADQLREVPLAFLVAPRGPTAEFILGRVFEQANNSARRGVTNVYTEDGKINPPERIKATARNRFREANCTLLGN